MGPLPGKFALLFFQATVPVAFNFLSTALTVDMGIFRRVAILYSQSLIYGAQHTFTLFDLCVLLSFSC